MIYQLRLEFDAGSGVCLWAQNEATRARYGYAVDHWQLPLSENTRRWLNYVVAWFDTSLDWSAPSDMDDQWSELELKRFLEAKERALALLQDELPPAFTVTV